MVNMFSFHHFLKFGRVFYSKREKHGSISRTATGCQAHKTFDKTAFSSLRKILIEREN